MKREFLQEFRVGEHCLPKEVIDAIMAENGRDIQKAKAKFADYEDMKAELSRLQKAMEEQQTNAQTAADWEEKYNQTVEAHKQQLAQMAFDKALGEGIAKARGRNAKAIAALLDMEALKESENQTQAIEDALEALKKENRYLFDGEVPPPYARGTGTYGCRQEKHPTTLAGALREKFERK